MSRRAWRWQDWPLAAKSAAVVAIPVTLMLASLASSYSLQQGASRAESDLRRALAIQADIQALHTQIAEAATGVRGYLLTRREDFLVPYLTAREQIAGTLAALRHNVRDPEQLDHLARVESLLPQKLDSLDDLTARGPSLAPQDLQAHLLGGKRILDDLRAEVRTMYEREAALLAGYSAAAGAALRRNLLLDAATSLLALASGIAALLLLSSGVVRRVQQLSLNADRLARGEPLAALPASHDELGELATRLESASVLLAARAAEADAASQAKTQFLSRTSHELRTPLNAILGFAQLLEADLRNTPSAPAVEQVLRAGRHLLTLIDEVFDVARIESGDMKLALAPLPLEPLLREAHGLLAPLAERHGIQLRTAAGGSGRAVHADRQRLLQVLLNLMSNAIKYNRPGGEVDVSVTLPSLGGVAIAVRDTGVGIDAAQMPRLFMPFDRLDAERDGVEGTGLGLAVSKQLVERMGGRIDVESRPGHGSTFTVWLARAEPPPAPAAPLHAPRAGDAAPSAAAMRTLLCVEDNASNLALVEALVARRPGWRLVVARSGRDGLHEARARRPDLILLDLHLHDVTGEFVLRELRADPDFEPAPVVMLSADALPPTIERLRAAGAADYLTKPLDVARFLRLLDQVT